MKQKFDKKFHSKFSNYFKIKEKPWKIEKKFYKKTEKFIKFIKWLPWLKMIWIWNSIAMNCANRDSDIDLFIITSPNSLWLNRIFITFIFHILNVRKTEKKHAWRFCLSFFATTNWIDFSSWKIDNDLYLYFWIIYLKPILDYNNTYNLFLEKNSSWADFSDYYNIIQNNKKYIKYTCNNNNNNNFILKYINNFLKKIFLQKTIKHYEKIWKPYWVIINDNLLKFHNWDIRKKIKEIIL